MASHPSFPTSAYAPLIPEERWFPANEDLRSTAYEKLLPPNGHEGRNWRDGFKLDFVFVDEKPFEKWFQHQGPKAIASLAASFTEYKS